MEEALRKPDEERVREVLRAAVHRHGVRKEDLERRGVTGPPLESEVLRIFHERGGRCITEALEMMLRRLGLWASGRPH